MAQVRGQFLGTAWVLKIARPRLLACDMFYKERIENNTETRQSCDVEVWSLTAPGWRLWIPMERHASDGARSQLDRTGEGGGSLFRWLPPLSSTVKAIVWNEKKRDSLARHLFVRKWKVKWRPLPFSPATFSPNNPQRGNWMIRHFQMPSFYQTKICYCSIVAWLNKTN